MRNMILRTSFIAATSIAIAFLCVYLTKPLTLEEQQKELSFLVEQVKESEKIPMEISTRTSKAINFMNAHLEVLDVQLREEMAILSIQSQFEIVDELIEHEDIVASSRMAKMVHHYLVERVRTRLKYVGPKKVDRDQLNKVEEIVRKLRYENNYNTASWGELQDAVKVMISTFDA